MTERQPNGTTHAVAQALAKLPEQAEVQLPDIIRRYLDGESIQALAAEHNVNRRTIYNWMLTGLGDEAYGELVTQVLACRVADADERLETAANGLDIARAREMAKFARQDLERRRPELYGAKQEVRHVMPEPLRIVVSAPQIAPQHGNPGITIEHEPVK